MNSKELSLILNQAGFCHPTYVEDRAVKVFNKTSLFFEKEKQF